MRMSCNGCRVLRKGCSDDCTIRPCLQWIKTPESQAHATLFLAKFYGRAGLLNLINAGPNHLRPAIFRSLLYEACGRILNPIYGSVGLLWSGNWPLCQNAVDAVLKGSPIKPISPSDDDDASTSPLLPSALKDGYNIRHVIKDPHHLHHSTSSSTREVDSNTAHRVRNRTRFKKSSSKPVIKCSHDQSVVVVNPAPTETVVDDVPVRDGGNVVSNWVSGSLSPSRDSSMSHGNGETNESMVSVEMTEAVAPVGRERISSNSGGGCEPEVDLRLGLGFGFGFECSRGGSGTDSEQKKSNLNDRVLDKRRTGFVTELGLS